MFCPFFVCTYMMMLLNASLHTLKIHILSYRQCSSYGYVPSCHPDKGGSTVHASNLPNKSSGYKLDQSCLVTSIILKQVQYSINGAVTLIIFTQNTFTQVRTWVNKLRTLASPDIVIALAGNKADLEAQRMVNTKVSCSSFSPHYSWINLDG